MTSADRLIRDGVKAARGAFTVLVVASVTAALATLVLPHAIGRAIDHALTDAPADAPLGLTWTQVAVGALLGMAVAESVIAFCGGHVAAAAGARVRHLMLRHATAAGPRLTRSIPAGDLASRTTANAGQAGDAPMQAVAGLAAAIPAIGATVMLFRIDPWCGGAFLLGLLALTVLLTFLVRTVTDVTEKYAAAQGDIAGRLTEALAGARTVAAAGTTGAERSRVLEPVDELRRHGKTFWTAQAGAIGQSAALLPMLEVIVLAVAGWQLTAGRISVGDMVAAGAYVALGVEVINALAKLVSFATARGAARRCAAVLDVPATGYGAVAEVPGPGALTLVDVWVGTGEDAALRGVTLHIRAGSCVAVVGRSGSGKSTLAALFGRLVDPDNGVVCIDGQLVRDLDPAALHTAVTYAFPRPALLGNTVAGTIAFGHHRPGPETVVTAAEAACADTFIRRMPLGYATPLSDAPMSGGEAQRLGLARAFAHPGRVLVLDDATSSLDTVTELQVTAAVQAAGAGQTRVIVAHRASTAARADYVIWLDGGRVRGYARHAELWSDPAYRAVFGTGAPEAFVMADLFTTTPAAAAASDPVAAADPVAAPGTIAVPDPVATRSRWTA